MLNLGQGSNLGRHKLRGHRVSIEENCAPPSFELGVKGDSASVRTSIPQVNSKPGLYSGVCHQRPQHGDLAKCSEILRLAQCVGQMRMMQAWCSGLVV